MRWYINDSSLQGQFHEREQFLSVLVGLAVARVQHKALQTSMYTTRSMGLAPVVNTETLQQLMAKLPNGDKKRLIFTWLDKTGPFLDDDRLDEADDYFEYEGLDVTETGLGESARRIKSDQAAIAYSFSEGRVNFATTPLVVKHGLPDERYGDHQVPNLWTLEALKESASQYADLPSSWQELVQVARGRYPNLQIPDAIFENKMLHREQFDLVICERTLVLLGHLDSYMNERNTDGSDSTKSRAIYENFFVGDRALFSAESKTNINTHSEALTFPDPDTGRRILAEWHGKISHRVFRLHFEWPVPADSRLKILYLGPKLTKT